VDDDAVTNRLSTRTVTACLSTGTRTTKIAKLQACTCAFPGSPNEAIRGSTERIRRATYRPNATRQAGRDFTAPQAAKQSSLVSPVTGSTTGAARGRSAALAVAACFITGSDFLMDGGVTAAFWYGDLAEVRTKTQS
jgi:hypothetical protein